MSTSANHLVDKAYGVNTSPLSNFFFDKMSVYLHMPCSIIVNWIAGYVYGSFVFIYDTVGS